MVAQTFRPAQQPSWDCNAMWDARHYRSHISISNLIFYTYPGIRHMTSLHVFIVLSLPYTQPLGISSVGCRKSRVQQFTVAFACGSLFQSWPSPMQSNRNVWEGVQQDLWTNSQLCQHFPWVLTSQRGQSLALGTASGAQLWCVTCYTTKPPLLPHIYCAEVTLVCKTLACARLHPSQPASLHSILCPLKTARTLCQGWRAGRHSGLAKCSTCRSIKLWPWVHAERWDKLSMLQTITGRWRTDKHCSAL